MNFDGNIRDYGEFDMEALRACVARQPESAWREDPFRQEKFHTHTETETMYLIFDEDFRHTNPTRLPRYEEFSSALQPLIETISRRFDDVGWVVRCLLTRLQAGGQIALHSDRGFSLTRAHRFHIPVITNEGVRFTVGDETARMKPGEIWEINNTRRHGVVNLGAEPRVHLILDWAMPLTHADVQAYAKDRQERRRRGASAGRRE